MIKLSGPAADLFSEISKLPVIDAHEHLHSEAERTRKRLDAIMLFSHYCKADLESAGLSGIDIGWEKHEIFDTSKPVLPRWKKLKPYFEAVRYGSYAYTVLAYVRDVLGFPDLNDSTVEAVSEKLQADNKPGLYKRILRERCNIEKAIQCKEGVEKDVPDLFVYLGRDRACSGGATFQERSELLEKTLGRSIRTLDDYADALGAHVALQKKKGCVGLKVGAAYQRSIDFADVARAKAEQAFVESRRAKTPSLSTEDQRLLENWLMRRQVEACVESDMPVVIHTGYQAGIKNDIRNARATLLWSLLRDYPKARFDLFHGSFPYTGDMCVLGKYFPNVWLNMCWMHIMSPEGSQRALAEWLDMVPVTKIFAFGGDNLDVEHIYGHLELARADVARVLAAKVTEGRMFEKDAVKAARLMFYENPKRFYGL